MKKIISFTFLLGLIFSVYFFACSPVTKSEDSTTTTTTVNTLVGTWGFVLDPGGTYTSNSSGYSASSISSLAVRINADNTAIMGKYSGGSMISGDNYAYNILDDNRVSFSSSSSGFIYIWEIFYENSNQNAVLTFVISTDPITKYTKDTKMYCTRL